MTRSIGETSEDRLRIFSPLVRVAPKVVDRLLKFSLRALNNLVIEFPEGLVQDAVES